MKFLISIFFLLVISNNDPIFIKGKNYKGYVFPKEYSNKYYPFNNIISYTPTKDDIILAESILFDNIKNINKEKNSQSKNCPVIHKNLCKYNRQYFGQINKNGAKVIFINMIHKNKTPSYWSKEMVIVMDGCSYYWNVKINIENKTVYDLEINTQS